jgi:hypothetical protein
MGAVLLVHAEWRRVEWGIAWETARHLLKNEEKLPLSNHMTTRVLRTFSASIARQYFLWKYRTDLAPNVHECQDSVKTAQVVSV